MTIVDTRTKQISVYYEQVYPGFENFDEQIFRKM